MKPFRLIIAAGFVSTGVWLTCLAASGDESSQAATKSVTAASTAPVASASSPGPAAPASTAVPPSPASFTAAAVGPLFLAVVEQLGTNSGKIDLFNVTLGGSGAADSFVANSPASLAVTNSTNEGKPDVDNPRDMLFDGVGDLLIANGGQGGAGGDYGSFACVPAGAIATGSTSTTTNSANAFDPESIALGTDSSVAVANVPASAAYNMVEYILGATYTPAATNRDIANPLGGNAVGATSVVALPTLTAGTFAASITNGTTISRVTIKAPSGTETPVTDPEISSPEGLGWDAGNNQLAIVNHNITTTGGINHNTSKLVLFNVSPTSKVKSVQLGIDPTTSTDSYMFGDKVAVSPDGHIAVAGGTADGPAEVRIYDNTSSRNPIGGPLPFDTYTNTACSTGYFGNVTVVYQMKWLSNTKLLVALRANGAGKQGVYIYDISTLVSVPAGLYRYDGNGGNCTAVTGTIAKQTGFQAITNPPLAAVVRPFNVTYADPAGTCSGNGPCYNSINSAIAATTTGGIINVLGGTFNESVNLNANVIINLDANTTVNDFTMSAGTLNAAGGNCAQANGANLTLRTGNWVNNGGTFNGGSSTVSFTGSAAQSVGGTTPTTFGNVTVNNAAGVTLNTAATVNFTLTLANGALNNGANLTLANSASIVRNNNGAPGGSLGSAPTFGATANLTYTGNVAITTGPEIPVSSTVLSNLTINNSAGVNLNSNATVNGTLTLQSGPFAVGTNTLTMNSAIALTSGTLTSSATGTVNYNQGSNGQTVIATNYGNLTFSNFTKTLPSSGIVSIAGTFATGATGGHTITGSTIQFNGTNAQTLPANFTTYNNLTINNASGVTLGGNITVNGAFTLTSGNITTAANVLSIGASGTRSRTSGYIIGNEKKTYSANGSFTYDVGTTNGYSPVDVTTTAGTGDLTVVAVQGGEPSVVSNRSLQRYWTLTKGGAGVTANLVFHYLDPTDIMGTESNYQVLQITGGARTYYTNSCPAPCVNGAANTFALNGVTNFSDFTAGEARADLQMTNSAAANVVVGNNLTYTIGLTNAGPDTSTSPTVTDAVPAQTTLVSVSTPAGWTRTDSVPVGGTGTIGFSKSSMANAETATFTIVVKVNANAVGGSTISDTATAASAITIDPDLTNNSGTAMTVVYTPPAITSGNNTTFVVGTSGSFAVTTTGYPTPTVAESGTLPNGVTFDTSTNILSGTPAAGTGGTYPITFTATNVVGSTPAQSFTLTVNQAPAITSANTTTFTKGTAGTFTVTATGFPTPTINLTSGSLPAGVNYAAGMGNLSGTPTVFGTFPLTFTASNGVGSNAVQNFSLVVNPSAQDVKSGPSISGNPTSGFNVGFIGNPGTQYTVQWAPVIPALPAAPNWQTLSLQTASASGVFSLNDTPPAGTTQRFYRAIVP